MKKLSLTQLFSILFVLVFALVGASVLTAWTGPSQSPPLGNVSAPVNVGATDQVKNAGLGVDALAVFGNTVLSGISLYLNFGESDVGEPGYGFRDNAGVMEYKDEGGNWIALASLSAPTGGGSGDPVPDGTYDLYGGVHTSDECLALGGAIKWVNQNEYICEITGTSCTSGWTKLEQWTSTASKSCSGGSCGYYKGTSCTTSFHGFSNISPEVCSYLSGKDLDESQDTQCGFQSRTCGATITTNGCY